MSATPRVDALARLINSVHSGPQGAAVPLTREQRMEIALLKIRDEASWVSKRRLKAHQGAMSRITEIVNDGLAR